MSKVQGSERTYMLDVLKAKYAEGYTKKQIMKHINKIFSVDYKEDSFKHLKQEAEHGDYLTTKLRKENEYMEKCKAEYTQTEDTEVPFIDQIKYVGGTQWIKKCIACNAGN